MTTCTPEYRIPPVVRHPWHGSSVALSTQSPQVGGLLFAAGEPACPLDLPIDPSAPLTRASIAR